MTPDDTPAPATLPPHRSGYADWAAVLDRASGLPGSRAIARKGPTRLNTALVRLLDRDAALRALAAGTIRVDATTGDLPEDPDETVLIYWQDEGAGAPAFAEVVADGAMVELSPDDPDPAESQAAPVARQSAPAAAPVSAIVAVIDDGIGFLNARFCRSDPAMESGLPLRTRFHAVWLQSLRAVPGPGGTLAAGRVLRRPAIDALLSQGTRLEEAATYRRLNTQLLRPGAPRLSERGTSHGTHVLDLAAGALPDDTADPARDWALLAVQLPPEAVDDTAGTWLEPLLVQAVRWCLRQAEAVDATAPVIINISYATFAGPKDGTKAVEALIARAVDRWRARTGREARVVLAFGNARLTRQAARLSVAADAPASLDWRLPPDDHTASYLEIRPDRPKSLSRLTLGLTPPGAQAAQVIAPLAADTYAEVADGAGQAVGRLYHIGARRTAPGVTTPAHLLLAMAPTSEHGTRPRAPHGGWRLDLSATGGNPVALRIEVQRDDTPMGYRLNGRQSYLDHPGAEGWDTETHDYGAPEPGCPITRAGTHSSFATAPSAAVITVGAARDDTRAPSRYAAEGADFTARSGPDLAALGDRSPLAPGLVGSGTFSGSGRALDGSSAAAARVTRALALHLAAGPSTPGAAEIGALVAAWGQPAAPALANRLGAGVLTDPRDRRL
ncbi:MAG: hypothetical protein KF887_07490 [Paracoccaceae bacterium]|nr:MAG: hypothetical protein KF887_07490 [Paracoccaceae bacterium]